jgi:hypothetical protein
MSAPVASVCRVISSREAPSRQHPVVGGREKESEANVRTRMRQAQGRRELRAVEEHNASTILALRSVLQSSTAWRLGSRVRTAEYSRREG